MGTLTKPGLEDLLNAGCSCGEHKLAFDTYVDGRFALLAGEPFGAVVWAYKGETFVDGVFEISCVGCKKNLFSSDVCPRCNAPGVLGRVMESPNRLPIPRACPRCETEKITYTAMLPARVVYEGKRAQKARASIDIVDDGFHGYRAECKSCGILAQITNSCPLCAAPAPLRERPH